ncbi:hypothetical protein ABBQ32_012347 [Trebouxia sp. C0010 RCD-2024]
MASGEPASATVVAPAPAAVARKTNVKVRYQQYRDERDLDTVMSLVDNELSEPYSIFTYRYFLHNWPQLAFLAYDGDHCFGTVVCKMDVHREQMLRGYLAMLVVEKPYRSLGTGTELVKLTIGQMIKEQCEEVVLEAEVTNSGALTLYQNLGFIRDKRLHRYYLNGVDAFRLKLLLPLTQKRQDEIAAEELKQLSLSHGLHGTPSSSAPSADATKHGQPQNQQDQKEQHDLVRAGQTCQESQPNTAHDLLQRYDALRT